MHWIWFGQPSEDLKSLVALHCKMVTQSDTPSPVLLPAMVVSLFEKTGTQHSPFLLSHFLSELYSEIVELESALGKCIA